MLYLKFYNIYIYYITHIQTYTTMYNNYKIVCNTAAGRRRYMQYLIPLVISSDLVDRYDIWVNTNDNVDIEFFTLLAKKYPKINLVWQPEGIVDGINSINSFYRYCTEEDTIYIKLDDDIVWMEDGFFKKIIDFRINNPQYFVVSPLVINNAICTYILQLANKIKLSTYMNAASNHRIMWKKGTFAVQLHNWFINKYLKTERVNELYCGEYIIGMNRFSINCILWFGSEMKKFDGVVPGDDEEFLSCIKSTQLKMSNAIDGNTVISHFAFFTQRNILDKCKILEQYGEYLHEKWSKDEKMKMIDHEVQNIMTIVNENAKELYSKELIYKTVPKSNKTKIKGIFKKYQKAIRNKFELTRNKTYIQD